VQGGAQAGLLEEVGMQVEHRPADLRDALVEALPRERRGLGVVGVEQLACGEEVLQRLVVQRLGQAPAGAVLGVERLRHEAPAARGQRGDLARPPRETIDRSVAAVPIHPRNSTCVSSKPMASGWTEVGSG
jgi:hypothetical protein